MKNLALWFTAPRQVELRPVEFPRLQPGQALVQAEVSAISPGTEMLFYRGHFPTSMALDANIPALAGPASYPLQYGYSQVGRVVEVAPDVDPAWRDRRVFAFQPHQQFFAAPVDSLFCIPAEIPSLEAVFFPNLETAAGLVMDGAPLVGERVAVFGQGVVGLLTAALLARFPLQRLLTLDCYPARRQASLELGAHDCLDPALPEALPLARQCLGGPADLVFEISGSPQALDQAIALTGFGGRVMIGSWYGSKPLQLNLGAEFHRSRIRLLSSQVSTIDPSLGGRWTKARRFELVWNLMSLLQPARWLTHRFAFEDAAQAYQLIDQRPEQAIQVVLIYP